MLHTQIEIVVCVRLYVCEHRRYSARLNRVGRDGVHVHKAKLGATRHGYEYACARSGSKIRTKGHMQRQTRNPCVTNVLKKSAMFENSWKDDDWTTLKQKGEGAFFSCSPRKITKRMQEPLRNERFHNFVNATTCAVPPSTG